MQIKDSIGNPLEQGDNVAVTIGNELALGTVVKIEQNDILIGSGQGDTLQAQQTAPKVLIQVILQRDVIPQLGVTVNVLKVESPKDQT